MCRVPCPRKSEARPGNPPHVAPIRVTIHSCDHNVLLWVRFDLSVTRQPLQHPIGGTSPVEGSPTASDDHPWPPMSDRRPSLGGSRASLSQARRLAMTCNVARCCGETAILLPCGASPTLRRRLSEPVEAGPIAPISDAVRQHSCGRRASQHIARSNPSNCSNHPLVRRTIARCRTNDWRRCERCLFAPFHIKSQVKAP